ncbi:MAG TPA: hypothetical protein VLA60_14095 [Nitrospirales bacterium]|nr:hypothetical protein [Nitrospirales bacterium]
MGYDWIFTGGGGIGSGLSKGSGALINAVKGTYRTTPANLAEKLALEEAKGGAGKRIMEGKIRDPRLSPESEWSKMKHVHSHSGGNETIIHYWKNLINGSSEGFKFK